jgi:hypothetical protein
MWEGIVLNGGGYLSVVGKGHCNAVVAFGWLIGLRGSFSDAQVLMIQRSS